MNDPLCDSSEHFDSLKACEKQKRRGARHIGIQDKEHQETVTSFFFTDWVDAILAELNQFESGKGLVSGWLLCARRLLWK